MIMVIIYRLLSNRSLFSHYSFELIKEIEVPSQVNSASLHPEKNVFVCGGEDFKMYKFDYNTGVEIGELCSPLYALHRTCNLFVNDGCFISLYVHLYCVSSTPSAD